MTLCDWGHLARPKVCAVHIKALYRCEGQCAGSDAGSSRNWLRPETLPQPTDFARSVEVQADRLVALCSRGGPGFPRCSFIRTAAGIPVVLGLQPRRCTWCGTKRRGPAPLHHCSQACLLRASCPPYTASRGGGGDLGMQMNSPGPSKRSLQGAPQSAPCTDRCADMPAAGCDGIRQAVWDLCPGGWGPWPSALGASGVAVGVQARGRRARRRRRAPRWRSLRCS